jgi:hypothetical protein
MLCLNKGRLFMTAIDEIEAFLVRGAGESFCDDCMSALLGIHPRQQVNQKTNMLAQSGRFERRKGECQHCKSSKLVIGTRFKRVA